jgi:hypothetical protein
MSNAVLRNASVPASDFLNAWRLRQTNGALKICADRGEEQLAIHQIDKLGLPRSFHHAAFHSPDPRLAA